MGQYQEKRGSDPIREAMDRARFVVKVEGIEGDQARRTFADRHAAEGFVRRMGARVEGRGGLASFAIVDMRDGRTVREGVL